MKKKPDGHPTSTTYKVSAIKELLLLALNRCVTHQTTDAICMCSNSQPCGGRQNYYIHVQEKATHGTTDAAYGLTSVHVFTFVCKLERWIQWCSSIHSTICLWQSRYIDVCTIRTVFYTKIQRLIWLPISSDIQINQKRMITS